MDGIRFILKRIASSRWLLLAMNAVIILISLDSLWDMLALVSDTVANMEQLENISDAVATIYVAYGVAAEERGSLMKFSGVYPDMHNPSQEALDHTSHYHGLTLLVVGLFMEIGVQLIKLPDSVLDTNGMEIGIFIVNVLFILLSLWIFLRYSLQIFRSNKVRQAEELEIFVKTD